MNLKLLKKMIILHLLKLDRHIYRTHRIIEALGIAEELKSCDPMRWNLKSTLKAQIEKII